MVRDHEIRVDKVLRAQPITRRAGAKWIVKGKQPRFDFIDCEARDRAGEARREDDALGFLFTVFQVGEFSNRNAVRQLQSNLKGVRETVPEIIAHDNPVHDNIDIVLVLFVEGGQIIQLIERAIDLHPLKALLQQLRKFFAILAFAAPHDGC